MSFVRAEEFSDLRTYDAPDVVRHVMGFGGTPDTALSGPMQKMLDGGFIQAVKMVVDHIGFTIDPRIRATQEIAVATAPSTHRSASSNPVRSPAVSSTGRRWSTESPSSGSR